MAGAGAAVGGVLQAVSDIAKIIAMKQAMGAPQNMSGNILGQSAFMRPQPFEVDEEDEEEEKRRKLLESMRGWGDLFEEISGLFEETPEVDPYYGQPTTYGGRFGAQFGEAEPLY